MDELKAFLELTLLLVADPRTVALFGLLIVAAVIDVRRHRIPNWLTVSGLLFGLGYSIIEPFWRDHGFLWALGGAAIGFGALFPFWLLRMMGAGDVKLMAMAGSLLGTQAVLPALAGTLVAGGICAVAFSMWHGKLREMLGNVGRIFRFNGIAVATGTPMGMAATSWQSVGKLAFAVPIAAGTILSVTGTHFGFL